MSESLRDVLYCLLLNRQSLATQADSLLAPPCDLHFGYPFTAFWQCRHFIAHSQGKRLMGMKLLVSNLGSETDNTMLEDVFEAHGRVHSAEVMRDDMSGHSRGFAFVEFARDVEAVAAINAMHGADLEGRVITVTVAGKQQSRSSSLLHR
jgi:hypothetical protein